MTDACEVGETPVMVGNHLVLNRVALEIRLDPLLEPRHEAKDGPQVPLWGTSRGRWRLWATADEVGERGIRTPLGQEPPIARNPRSGMDPLIDTPGS